MLLRLTPLLLSMLLSGCNMGSIRQAINSRVYDSAQYHALIKNPESVVGKYYSMNSDLKIMGSLTFDDAIELHRLDTLTGQDERQIESNKSKINDLLSKNVWLNRGMNRENQKAPMLMKVVESRVKGERCAAVRILALNKFYAGSKWWIGSEDFLNFCTETSCPVANPDSLDADAGLNKKRTKVKPRLAHGQVKASN